MRLFTYEYLNRGDCAPTASCAVFRTPRGANSSALAFRKQAGLDTIDIRVVELVVKGTGRVVASYPAEIGEWH